MKTIGIAFLGSGFAQKVQAPAFETCPGVKLIGASSPNNSEKFAQQFSMPVHTADWKALVKRDDVDLVCVTSPPLLHHEQTMFALEHNKHILCEKPFAMNLTQAVEMAALAKKKNVMAIIDHELRFSPAVVYVRNTISGGELGKIYHASAVSHLAGRRDASLPYTWWSDKQWGGGAWGAIGSHLIDMLRYLVGEIADSKTIKGTAIATRKDKTGKDTAVTSDDMASATVKFENGALGYIFTTVVGNENKMEFEVTGEKGSIKIDMEDNVWKAEAGKPYEPVTIAYTPKENEIKKRFDDSRIATRAVFSRAFVHLADALVLDLQAGKTELQNGARFEDGVRIQRILDGAQQ